MLADSRVAAVARPAQPGASSWPSCASRRGSLTLPNTREDRSGHSSDTGEWESAVRPPHPSLRPYVREYFGGSERTIRPLVRRELPGDIAPIIINFGPPSREIDRHDPSRWTEYHSFATGAYDTYVLVGTPNEYACVQINFTILGARVFLGRPLRELINRMVALDDLFGAPAGRPGQRAVRCGHVGRAVRDSRPRDPRTRGA